MIAKRMASWRHINAFLALFIAYAFVESEAGCALTADDWTAIYTALEERYYYGVLQSSNLCGNSSEPNSLLTKYSNCNQFLEDVLVNQNLLTEGTTCRTFLKTTLYNGPGISQNRDLVESRALEICSDQTFGSAVVKTICNPLRTVGCPRQLDVFQFTIFASCHSAVLANLTTEEDAEYFAENKDKTCMINRNVCKDFYQWATCPVPVQLVFDFIDNKKSFTCENTFPTVEDRCLLTFQANHENYCPPPTLFQANFYTIVVTCTVGPFALIALYLCYKRVYRAQHISSEEVLKQAQEVSDGDSFKFHPELAAIVESKYKGVTFNPATGEWSVVGKKEKFQDEQAAARFAYLNLAGLQNAPGPTSNSGSGSSYSTARSNIVSNDFPVAAYQGETEYVVTAIPLTPEQMKQRRLQQLISFYEYWEPTKPDIPAHAENLLNRHDFEHVARAVKTKYGVLPPGWAEELEV